MAERYDHTQHGPVWTAFAVGVAVALTGALLQTEVVERVLCLGIALVFAFLAACFATLTVRDQGEFLEVRYGPLPLWGTSLRYEDIRSVRATVSRWIDGWGIHWVPWRGWTFNIWGFRCVEVTTAKGTVRIGSDDSEALAAFLAARAGAAS